VTLQNISFMEKPSKQILLGNEAIALGAIAAGARLVAGYPGTPSTEVLQTVAARNTDGAIHVEWSTNEKAALEVAAGAAWSGARAMAVMKQVGLNVAADPLMSLVYLGVRGGLVIVVADDPGPISSQTEQDTRFFAAFANAPALDPSCPEEAYAMALQAFDLSERYGLPVILRPTTKVCHASAAVDLSAERRPFAPGRFERSARWVIFPPLSYRRHGEIKAQQAQIGEEFSVSEFNRLEGDGPLGIAAGGVTYAILRDALMARSGAADWPAALAASALSVLKVGAVFPPPKALYRRFLSRARRVLVLEELAPVIEEQLLALKGAENLTAVVAGKLSGFVAPNGELLLEQVARYAETFLSPPPVTAAATAPEPPVAVTAPEPEPAPVWPRRSPVLCAGCPHRASFYAVKKATRGQRAVFCGDIGCYTLGNAAPLDMTDTCLCMGAGLTVAQGVKTADPQALVFAFIGDGTFFASGMTGLLNAAHNRADINIMILDNSTTAMTGHQSHPGLGRTVMGEETVKIDAAAVARALGAGFVERADPFDLPAAMDAARRAASHPGLSVVIFTAPCSGLFRPTQLCRAEKCSGCMLCVREIGCPALRIAAGVVEVNAALCHGCGLCARVCPSGRLRLEARA
jgi:indolepyruvate ferredoxin oxidoreductase alpha subunit